MIIEIPQPPLIIQTRAGNAIPNERGLKMTDLEVRQWVAWQQGEFPEGQILRVRKLPSGAYNCHGMTFLSRRGFVLDEDAVALVLQDDQYYQIEDSQVRSGDVILYYYENGDLEHSGVVAFVDPFETVRVPWILSKWGQAGEYLHRYNYCPYNWRRVRYMREGQHD
jgi:hypothetical protein